MQSAPGVRHKGAGRNDGIGWEGESARKLQVRGECGISNPPLPSPVFLFKIRLSRRYSSNLRDDKCRSDNLFEYFFFYISWEIEKKNFRRLLSFLWEREAFAFSWWKYWYTLIIVIIFRGNFLTCVFICYIPSTYFMHTWHNISQDNIRNFMQR